jgi:ankyrin repeat protein
LLERPQNGAAPIHLAVAGGHVALIQSFLEAKADIQSRNLEVCALGHTVVAPFTLR